jgi:uncharacterized protein YdeI (YjbR/CyaY-like superfamily)
MATKDIETFYPKSSAQWRRWLEKNHRKKQSIWLIFYKKSAKAPTLTWSEAVDEALCFGWIDGTKKSIDEERSIQYFSRRKPKSVWSKINKGKVQRLIDEEKMTKAGFESIETAKQNGSWEILNDVEELKIPKDLAKAFRQHKGSKTFFLSLSKSVKKMILQWLIMAKRPETREKRIKEIAERAAKKLKPKHLEV